jgi:putative phosphoesterase
VGVISDTHGLLRPEALVALAGVDHVLHAGDIGDPSILSELGRIAPVTAVRGNNDRGAWAVALPEIADVKFSGVGVRLIHDVRELGRHTRPTRPDVVVSGHSHKPLVQEKGNVLYLNPGSAGPRRFSFPVALGFLEIVEHRPRARIVELHVAPTVPPRP